MKLSLKYPVTPFIINQHFGDDSACYRASDQKVVTKIGDICPVGFTSLYAASGMKGHNATDLYATDGTPIYHCGPDGFVEEVQSESARGLGLGIVSNDKFEHEAGETQVKLRYWHLKDFNVGYDDVVKTGDLIGWADNTGFSSGSHLHLELKPVAKNSKGSYYNLLQENGYYGGISPEPYLEHKFIFNKNMKLGDSNSDVKELQKRLNELGFTVSESGAGSKGNETDYFGFKTRQALAKFQVANGISLTESVFGYWCGQRTRQILNK